jgi:hypothetical protein
LKVASSCSSHKPFSILSTIVIGVDSSRNFGFDLSCPFGVDFVLVSTFEKEGYEVNEEADERKSEYRSNNCSNFSTR